MPAYHTDDAGGTAVLSWFALRVRSNHERVAALHLRERGYEEFCPSYRAERRWSDRVKVKDRALFPGYAFCRMNPKERLPVLTVPGVVSLVSFGKEPCPIPDHEIENIRSMLKSGVAVLPSPFLKIGQAVRIERGPLSGIEGILQELKGTLRIIVSIELLRRSVSAEIERAWIRPIAAGGDRRVSGKAPKNR